LVRLVLAISLDGRLAPPRGGAAQLGGPGDRCALEQSLAWADAALIGAGTLRAHRNTCLIHDPVLLDRRRHEGRAPQPAALLVSHQHTFPAEWPFFSQPLRRGLLTPSDGGSVPPGFDDRHDLAPRWPDTLQSLAIAGYGRLLLLGGAGLAADMLRADAVDELQFTLTPRLLGGPHCWLPTGSADLPETLSDAKAWRLKDVERLEGSEVVLRYGRQRFTSS